LTNALIGFCRNDSTWPNVLRLAGWHVSMIEPSWVVDVPGQQQPARIKPDLVLASDDGRHVLLAECKVGTVQADQKDRYKLLTLTSLQVQSYEQPLDDFQISYVTTEPHEKSCSQSLQGDPFPLLIFSDTNAYIAYGTYSVQSVQDLFAMPGVDLSGLRPPTQYLPLDTDSSPEELLTEVLRALIKLSVADVGTFDLNDVVRAVFGDSHKFLHPVFRNEMRQPIERALNQIAKPSVLGAYISRSGSIWALSPDLGGPTGRTYVTVVRRLLDKMGELHAQLMLDL
jgi:hypothetical protein